MKNLISVQEWINLKEILDKGVIKLKDDTFIKIISISPINYSLKSELEKKAILNSYKNFLKICNFNFQILIQSNKENLDQIISKINNQNEKNKKIIEIKNNYIKYINKISLIEKSYQKIFYIVIKSNNKTYDEANEELNEKYLKIKENLSNCGNSVEEIDTKEKTIQVMQLFYNRRLQDIN